MTTHQHVPLRHLIAGVTIGGLVALQSRVNGDLGVAVNDGVTAAWLSFLIGTAALVAIVALRRASREGVANLRRGVRQRHIKWWEMSGGIFGALIVTGQTAVVPVIGVALFSVALVGGSTAGSLIVDRSRISPGGPKEVTPARLLSAVIATVGVAIAAFGDASSSAVAFSLVVVLVLLVAVVGGSAALQGAINGRLRGATGDTFVATLVNFLIGWVAIGAAWLVIHLPSGGSGITMPPMPWQQPLIWTGGLLGFVFVAVTAELVKSVGVLVLGLTNVFGQIAGALLLDVFMPVNAGGVSAALIIGSAITVVAVFIGAARPRKVAV